MRTVHIHVGDAGPNYSDWKMAQEYEGRLWGGSYDWSRIERGEIGSAGARMIKLARERYNELRVAFGLRPVMNWRERPSRSELVQSLPEPSR